MRILYLPNKYSQQRQREKPANIYPVLMAMECEKHRKDGDTVHWDALGIYPLSYYDKIIQEPEGLPFLSLPHPDRIFTGAKRYTSGNYKYLPGTHMQVANGCWWGKCSFCVENRGSDEFGSAEPINSGSCSDERKSSHSSTKYEVRPVEDCIEEIKEIKSQGYREVFDDSGTFPIGDWLYNFCRRLLTLKPISFGCNMRLVDIDYSLLRRSGFRMVLFGLESANQPTLDKINKGTKVEDIKYVIKASKCGLEPHVSAIVGFPWESEKETLNTLNLIKWLLVKGYAKTAQMSFYTPPKNQQQGNEEYRKYVNKFYEVGFNPEFWWHKITDIHNIDDFKYLIRELKEGWRYYVGRNKT